MAPYKHLKFWGWKLYCFVCGVCKCWFCK